MTPILISARAKIFHYMSPAVLYGLPMYHGMSLTDPTDPYFTQGINKILIAILINKHSANNPSSQFLQTTTVAMKLFTIG